MTTSFEERRWRELRAQLSGFVGRRVRNPADAEDVVQDVFLRIQRGVATLASTDRLDAWAFRIARNAVADYYRAPNRREVVDDSAGEVIDHLATDEVPTDARAEMARCITPMVRQLPDDYREAIELTELGG